MLKEGTEVFGLYASSRQDDLQIHILDVPEKIFHS